MDITLHCVDGADLKTKGLNEVCPSICKFNQISHCAATRRIAGKFFFCMLIPFSRSIIWIEKNLVGASNGHLAIYELRQNKCQMIPAHKKPITALAFSPDGKFLVSYSCGENGLSFWQTSTGE